MEYVGRYYYYSSEHMLFAAQLAFPTTTDCLLCAVLALRLRPLAWPLGVGVGRLVVAVKAERGREGGVRQGSQHTGQLFQPSHPKAIVLDVEGGEALTPPCS